MMGLCVEQETIEYIISFMFGENANEYICYSDQPGDAPGKPIVIRPSSFFDPACFGTDASMPALPLRDWHGTALLFGEPAESAVNGRLIIEADIIASAFFLMSRYEETVHPVRDPYGRFIGRESIPYKAGCIDRPIIEEYAAIVSKLAADMGISDIGIPHASCSKIYLTHDVDVPWDAFSFLSAVKRMAGTLKREKKLALYPIKNWLGNPSSDPRYTFQELVDWDASVVGAKPVYFFKSGGTVKPQDGAIYIRTAAARKLIRLVGDSGAVIGYHASFSAGQNPELVREELHTLRSVANVAVTAQRNHYLCSREPRDFYQLIANGITDDFTMGYADIAGFRLGTCRPVRWIDPYDTKLTSLVLHPLTIMECTLSGVDYMNLDYDAMQAYSTKLIDRVFSYGGEVVLLWHNQSIMMGDVQRELYKYVLDYLNKKIMH